VVSKKVLLILAMLLLTQACNNNTTNQQTVSLTEKQKIFAEMQGMSTCSFVEMNEKYKFDETKMNKFKEKYQNEEFSKEYEEKMIEMGLDSEENMTEEANAFGEILQNDPQVAKAFALDVLVYLDECGIDKESDVYLNILKQSNPQSG